MPWPPGPISAGVKGENAALHAWVDKTSEAPAVGQNAATANPIPIASFMEMLLGHRSGGVAKASSFLDNGSTRFGRGGTVTYAAGTLTDTNQAWTVNQFGAAGNGEAYGVWADSGQFNVIASNTGTVLTLKSNWLATPGAGTGYLILGVADQNQGATVSYAAGPGNALTDTAKAWIVNEWRGKYICVSGQLRQIVSNDATHLTLDAAWLTTPAAQQAYFITDNLYDSWLNTQRGSTAGPSGAGADLNPNNL